MARLSTHGVQLMQKARLPSERPDGDSARWRVLYHILADFKACVMPGPGPVAGGNVPE